MPLQLNKLTALSVARLSKLGHFGDGGGLVLQVSVSGSKSWLFRYRRNDRIRELGRGSVRTIDLGAAREAAKRCREQLQVGRDPLDERQLDKVYAALERGGAE
jgi:hypothetical protein